jgi:peptide/nickel transport system substrate-binding protein
MKSQFAKIACLVAIVALLASACAPAATPAPTQAPAKVEPTKAPAQPTAVPPTAVPPTKAPAPTAAPAKVAEYHGAFPYQVPPTGHWNSFVTNGIPNGVSIYQDLLEMPMARYNWGDGSWTYFMAEKVEVVPPDKVVATLRKGAKWSDGKDFTAKDVVATWNVGRLFN